VAPEMGRPLAVGMTEGVVTIDKSGANKAAQRHGLLLLHLEEKSHKCSLE